MFFIVVVLTSVWFRSYLEARKRTERRLLRSEHRRYTAWPHRALVPGKTNYPCNLPVSFVVQLYIIYEGVSIPGKMQWSRHSSAFHNVFPNTFHPWFIFLIFFYLPPFFTFETFCHSGTATLWMRSTRTGTARTTWWSSWGDIRPAPRTTSGSPRTASPGCKIYLWWYTLNTLFSRFILLFFKKRCAYYICLALCLIHKR